MAYMCTLDTLKIIDHTHIQSHINFDVSLYGATRKLNAYKILILQKKGFHIMLNLNKMTL